MIEWGDGIYGAEAAARTYFQKPAAALSPAESALLAARIINPRLLNPAGRPRACDAAGTHSQRMGVVTPPPDPCRRRRGPAG